MRWTIRRKRDPLLLFGILVLGALLRTVYSNRVDDTQFFRIDGAEYADLARNLYMGNGFSVSFYRWFEPSPTDPPPHHPDVYRPPLLPALGACLYALPGPWIVKARLLQVGLGTLTLLVGFLLVRSLYGTAAGLTAAGALAVHPYAIYYSGYWSTETLVLCLVVISLALLQHSLSRSRTLPVAGATLGLAALARPTTLALAVAFLVWTGIMSPRGHRSRNCLLLLLGLASVLTPWIIRNYQTARIITPVTAFAPYNFWLGNNPTMYDMYRSGSPAGFIALQDTLYAVESKRHVMYLQERGTLSPSRCNAYWLRTARDYVLENRSHALYIWLQRSLHYWRPWPNKAATGTTLFLVGAMANSLCGGLALCALYLYRHSVKRLTLLLIPPVVGWLASIPFAFHQRLRFPTYDGFLTLLASMAIAAALCHGLRCAPSAERGARFRSVR